MRDPYEYEEEAMNWREKEWDEPGPDFGRTIHTNRRTGETYFGGRDR
jgi:hypothetical protein